jgi:hypothetical protein
MDENNIMRSAFVTFYEAYPPISGAATVSFSTALYTRGERLLVQVRSRDDEVIVGEGLRVWSLNCGAHNLAGGDFFFMVILGELGQKLQPP